MSRHNKNFNGKIVIKSWQEIYVLLRDIEQEIKDIKSLFLLKQFLKYLEVINMAPFVGFEKEDFDFWMLEKDDLFYEEIDRVKRKMQMYLEEIRDSPKLSQELRKNFKSINVGNITKDSDIIWGSLSKDQNKQYDTHYSCRMSSDIFEVFITTQTKGLVNSFLDDMADKNKFKRFMKILGSLEGYKLTLKEIKRNPKTKRAIKYIPVCSFETNYVNEEAVNYFIQMTSNLTKEGSSYRAGKYCVINLEKEFKRDLVIPKAKTFVEVVVSHINEMQDYFDFMNF